MKLSPMAIGMALGAVLVVVLLFGVRRSRTVSTSPSSGIALPPIGYIPAPASTNLQTFFVRGVVKELKADGQTVVIDHEEIPNYMAKMVMPFKVKDTNQLAGLGTNDQIHFRFNVAEYESWIDQVTKTGTAAAPLADPNRKNFRLVREVDVLKEGDALPDYPFTNQRGESFRTAQFKGQALAITFIFTRCPVPDFCPRMSYRFAQADKQLRALPDAPTNYHLLSLSFDVDFDTPLVLQNYANTVKAQHNADLSRWTFATGKLIDIDDITERFGLAFAREPGTVPFNHTLRTVVIDAAGKVQKVFIGNDWKADALADEMVKAAKVKPDTNELTSREKWLLGARAIFPPRTSSDTSVLGMLGKPDKEEGDLFTYHLPTSSTRRARAVRFVFDKKRILERVEYIDDQGAVLY